MIEDDHRNAKDSHSLPCKGDCQDGAKADVLVRIMSAVETYTVRATQRVLASDQQAGRQWMNSELD